jgi:hypothetical protein
LDFDLTILLKRLNPTIQVRRVEPREVSISASVRLADARVDLHNRGIDFL